MRVGLAGVVAALHADYVTGFRLSHVKRPSIHVTGASVRNVIPLLGY